MKRKTKAAVIADEGDQNLTVQTAIRLPRDMHERLTKGGASFGSEVRRRLQASLDAERDPKTGELAKGIIALANTVALDGVWHEDRYAFEAFKAGISELLEHFKPEGEPVFRATPGLGNVYFGPDVKPEAVGRQHARAILRQMKG